MHMIQDDKPKPDVQPPPDEEPAPARKEPEPVGAHAYLGEGVYEYKPVRLRSGWCNERGR